MAHLYTVSNIQAVFFFVVVLGGGVCVGGGGGLYHFHYQNQMNPESPISSIRIIIIPDSPFPFFSPSPPFTAIFITAFYIIFTSSLTLLHSVKLQHGLKL